MVTFVKISWRPMYMITKMYRPGQVRTGPLSILCTALRFMTDASRPFLKQMLIDRCKATGFVKCTVFGYFYLVCSIHMKVAHMIVNAELSYCSFKHSHWYGLECSDMQWVNSSFCLAQCQMQYSSTWKLLLTINYCCAAFVQCYS